MNIPNTTSTPENTSFDNWQFLQCHSPEKYQIYHWSYHLTQTQDITDAVERNINAKKNPVFLLLFKTKLPMGSKVRPTE